MEKAVIRNIRLTDREFEIVRRYVKRENLGPKNFSLGVRKIINEWERMDQLKQALNTRPNEVGHE